MIKTKYFVSLVLLIFTFWVSIAKTEKREDREPEAATGLVQKRSVVGQKFMVAAANPYAAKAGKQMLTRGGSSIDAAIATL